MIDDINLLGSKRKNTFAQNKIAFFLTLSSYILLILVFSFSIALFILNKFSSYEKLEKEKSFVVSELSRYDPKAGKFVFVSSRLLDISNLISRRAYYDKIIELLAKMIPQDVDLESLTISNKSISMSFSSKNLESINSLFDNLVESAQKKVFIKINLSGLSSNESGNYSFSLLLNLE